MDHTITPDRLFDKWCTNQDDPLDLAMRLGITPSQLADLIEHPDFVRRVAAWRALTRAYRENLVFNHQNAAAVTLRATMAGDDPIEARRAATVLARLSRNMLPAGTARADTARGGTALQSRACDEAKTLQSGAPGDPAPTPNAPEATPSTLSTPTPQPSTPPHPLTAPPPLPFTAPPQVITKLAALAALAGTAQVARASGP